MNNTRNVVFCILPAVLLAASCATGDKKELPSIEELLMQMTEQDGRACYRKSDVEGYATLEDDVVSVNAGRKHYLVTTRRACAPLGSAKPLPSAGDSWEFCGGRGEPVVVHGNQCASIHVYEFVSREDAFATLEMVKAKREVQGRYAQ